MEEVNAHQLNIVGRKQFIKSLGATCKSGYAAFFFSILLASFSGTSAFADDKPAAEIRISNGVGFDLTAVVVHFPDGPHKYGPIKSGGYSEYFAVAHSLPYAKYDAYAGDKKFVYPESGAWCTVGDSFLEKGFYTFVIYYNEAGQLDIRCQEDKKP